MRVRHGKRGRCQPRTPGPSARGDRRTRPPSDRRRTRDHRIRPWPSLKQTQAANATHLPARADQHDTRPFDPDRTHSSDPERAPGAAPRRPLSPGRQCAYRSWPVASGRIRLPRGRRPPQGPPVNREGGHPWPGVTRRSARMRGLPPVTSTTLVRPDAPATSVTAPRRTPNAAATAASAASVALPSTARALTRTIRAPACPPPTPGRAEPGRTRIVIRTCLVCGRGGTFPTVQAGSGCPH